MKVKSEFTFDGTCGDCPYCYDNYTCLLLKRAGRAKEWDDWYYSYDREVNIGVERPDFCPLEKL
jgi:hypothetical protein